MNTKKIFLIAVSMLAVLLFSLNNQIFAFADSSLVQEREQQEEGTSTESDGPIANEALNQEKEQEDESEDQEEQDESDRDDQEQGDDEDEEDESDQEDGDDEEDRDERRVSAKQILSFIRKNLPELAEQIEELEEEVGKEEAREIILGEGRELLLGYLEIKETHGRRMGEKFLELFKVNFSIDRLLEEFGDQELDADDKPRLKKEVKQLIGRRYSLQLTLEKAELNRLKAEVEDFEEELRGRVENRDEIIEEETREILNEIGQDEGEDDREEEEEEEEDTEEDDESEEEDKEQLAKKATKVLIF